MSLYSRAEKVMRPALCSETAMDFLQEADATIATKDAEIARLRDALGKIAKGRTGLDPEESDAEWRAYWASLCIDYRSMARAALAQVAEVSNG